MDTNNQDCFSIEITPTPARLRLDTSAESRIVNTLDYVATALRKIVAAGRFGVHLNEIRIDALARFDELRVPYETFDAARRGTGNQRCWVRLALPQEHELRIVGDVA